MLSPDGETLFEFGHGIGIATNNIAEYRALEYVLRWAAHLREVGISVSELMIHSDSQLLVRQMGGSYKVKSKNLKPLYDIVGKLITGLPFRVRFMHVKRTENREADRLANLGFSGRN